MKVSASNNSLLMKNSSSQQFSNFNNNFNNNINTNTNNSTNNTRLDSVTNNVNITNNHNYDSIYASANARQLDCNKSIELAQSVLSPDEPTAGKPTAEHSPPDKSKIRRNSSVMSFKSLDISLKSIYSSFKKDRGHDKSKSGAATTSTSSIASSARRAPYVKVETVDQDEEHPLLTYPHSPGGSQQRRISDTSTTILDSTQYLTTCNYQELSRSQQSSSFLSVTVPSNLRRSSTSDIMEKKPNTLAAASTVDSRRPSTSDLLRRNRERKGSEGKLGRSSSHGSVSRGAMRSRRSSMAC